MDTSWNELHAARGAFVLMMAAPTLDAERVIVDRSSIRAHWLKYYPHHAVRVGSKQKFKANMKISDAIAQLEDAGLVERDPTRAQAVIIKNTQALLELASHLSDVEANYAPLGANHKKSQCPSGKEEYTSERTAMLGLLSTWQRDRPWRREKRAYKCDLCDSWHLTSKPALTDRA